MYRESGGGVSYVLLANALGDVATVEQHTVAVGFGAQLDARFLGQGDQCGSIIEPDPAGERLQRQGAVHGPAFQVDVAELLGQPRRQRALPRAGGAIDGNNEFVARIHARRGELRGLSVERAGAI